MPIYEYTCATCGAAEERLETLHSPAAHDCPSCGKPAGMKRILSVAAVATATGSPSSSGGSSPCGGGSCGCPFA